MIIVISKHYFRVSIYINIISYILGRIFTKLCDKGLRGSLWIYRYIVEKELRQVTWTTLGTFMTTIGAVQGGAYVVGWVSPLWDTNVGRRMKIALQSPINGPLQTTWVETAEKVCIEACRSLARTAVFDKPIYCRENGGWGGFFFWMEEGWNLIIYIKFGVCNFSTFGFMIFLFSGGIPP